MKSKLLSILAITPFLIWSQTAIRPVDFNGLKANIHSDGTIEQTQFTQLPGKNMIYANHLWIGGMDIGNTLFISAQTYASSGQEFQSGPISSDSTTIMDYSRVWVVRSSQIDSLVNGLYTNIPLDILDWPAHGDTSKGEAYMLAPFIDTDLNGKYEPLMGDYPCIKGDVCAYTIFNDDVHNFGIGIGLKAEFQMMVYGYRTNDNLNNVLFTDYKITNRSSNTYYDVVLSNWADFDIGNGADDLTGTNVNTQSFFAYNNDSTDGGPNGFGLNPPAAGITQLKGFYADMGDGIDNNWDGCVDGIRDASGNCIPESAQNREEVLLSSTSNYYNVNSPSTGNPFSGVDHFRYMNGLWKDGNHQIVETPCGFDCIGNGDGYVSVDTGIYTPFMYTGNSYDTNGVNFPSSATNWFSNPLYGNFDVRMIGSSGKITFAPGNELNVSYAQVATRNPSTLDRNYSDLQEDIEMVRSLDTLGTNCLFNPGAIAIPEFEEKNFSIYPNPAHSKLTISNEESETQVLTLMSVLGQNISTIKVSGNQKKDLDLSSLKSGIYFVINQDGNSQKLIIH